MKEEQSHSVSTQETGTAPSLWNPDALANWSLLFTPIFGTWLTYLNWQALGEAAYARRSKYWLIGSTVWVLSAAIIINVADNVSIGIGAIASYIILLLLWFFMENRKQNRYLVERFGKTYPRRGWLKPLAIAAAILVVWQLAIWAIWGNKNNTNLVRNGVMKFNQTLTIGEAFDNWGDCANKAWKEFKTDNGIFCPAEDKARSPYMMIENVYGAGWDSDNYAKDVWKIKNLKNAIGIPEDTPLEIFVGDF